MKRLCFSVCCWSLPLRAWQEPLTLDQALQRLHEEIAQFEASLPDFVCGKREESGEGSSYKKFNVSSGIVLSWRHL
jgi:hypothetical protein